MCAVCGEQVASVEEYYDAFMHRTTWIVRCHGETEVVRLDETECRRISFGLAFSTGTKRLK